MFIAASTLEPGPCGTMAISEARQITADWHRRVVSREEARAALLTAMAPPDAGAAASLWLDLVESDRLTHASPQQPG